ncbi:hypothetical protein AAGW56_04955, partial [Staphylococcus aureus]
MFKKHHSKNSILLKSILSLGIIYSGSFGIYSKAGASTQNSSSLQDKQFQKVEEVPNVNSGLKMLFYGGLKMSF